MLPPAHTPGPWVACPDGDRDDYGVLSAPDCTLICGECASAADARLIAAAPDLLLALAAVLGGTNLGGSGHPLEAQARAAIAKATKPAPESE